MQAVERLSSYISQGVYTVSGPFHPFGGAVDIIVVEQQDGSFKSSPWYVRFGKFLGVLKTREMVVKIFVNGCEAGFHMYLDHKGEAFFLKEYDSDGEEVVVSSASSGDDTDEGSGRARKNRVESCETESISKIDVENGKIVARTDARRSTFLGLVFGGKKPAKEDEGDENMPRLNSLERAEMAADLLETKWSTNLPTTSIGFGIDRKDHVIDESHEEDDALSNVTEGDGVMVDGAHVEHLGEEKTEFSPSFRARGEIVEVYSSENGDIISSHEILSDTPPDGNVTQLLSGLDDRKVIAEHIVDIQNELRTLVSNNNAGIPNELVDGLTVGELMEEGGGENASYIFYETIQSSTVRIDVTDGMNDSAASYSDRAEDVKHNDGVVVEAVELISQLEPTVAEAASIKVEDPAECVSDCEHSKLVSSIKVEGPSECVRDYGHSQMICESPVVRGAPNNEMSKPDLAMSGPTYETVVQDRTEEHTFEKQDVAKTTLCTEEGLSETSNVCMVEFEDNKKVDLNRSEEQNASSNKGVLAAVSSANAGAEGRQTFVDNPGFEADTFGMMNEVCVHGDHALDVNHNIDEAATPRSQLLSTSEDEHVLFSDVENFTIGDPSSHFLIDEEGSSDEHTFHEPEENSEHASHDIDLDESCKSSPNAAIMKTSPISIPIRRKLLDESDRLVKSLPNIPSQIHLLEMSDDFHLPSSSVRLNPEKFDLGFSKEDSLPSPKLAEGSPKAQVQSELASQIVTKENSGSSDAMSLKKEKQIIEISLCRHLLFEGMGVEAAAKAFDSEKIDFEKFVALGPSVVKNNKLIVRIGGRYFPWNVAAPIILGLVTFDNEQIFDSEPIKVEKPTAIVPSGGQWGIWPFRFSRSRSMKSERNTGDESKEKNDIAGSREGKTKPNEKQRAKRTRERVRFITPSSEELSSLNLKEGRNSVTFTFESAMLGRQQVDARIYLWKWNTRIVVSDVDGTITKSDVLGQFMPLVGKDWSQTGVAHLFSSIKENGYEFIFLSARAIAQAYITRQFLFNLKQDGKTLPDGPVVISPDGLFPSLYREVIRRAPHEFKISCLEEIKALFPSECNPFYAGFGNRHTDEISYLKVGIPKGKIFIINPRGQVAVNHLVDTRSYTSLNALVNGMFPPTTSVEQEEFNSWNFWKMPLPDIDD